VAKDQSLGSSGNTCKMTAHGRELLPVLSHGHGTSQRPSDLRHVQICAVAV
jgi:hypothetical protein